MRVPTRRGELNKKRDTGPVYLTQEGADKMLRKLKRLERDLPAQIKEVSRTRENGDFSENEEYREAKHTMRKMHGQVATIKDKLKRLVIIEEGVNELGEVRLGSSVVLQSAGKKLTFKILGSQETDPGAGSISHKSPLGVALIGKRPGQSVTIELKNGIVKYEILEVK